MGPVKKSVSAIPAASQTELIVLASQELVPEDIIAEGLLTQDDYRALALDHIERTCEFVFELRIVRRA